MTPAAAIAQSGLAAATLRLSASASNLANAGDVSAVGATNAYQPEGVEQSPAPGGGVIAQAVTLPPAQVIVYDPTSSVASAQGLVQQPQIDPIAEITNQLTAGRAFAYSLKAWKTAEDNEKTLLNVTA